jgi:23S rRNA (pseudouridine1915-N3)-methyltransferase
MHVRLIAVGDRQPSWVDEAYGVYSGRFPREWKFRLDCIATVRRTKNDKSKSAMRAEGEQLDERGKQMTSPDLATHLAEWQGAGRDLCFVIGGPDGVSSACRERANFTWSLSNLTMPHGFARVFFAEQMYRAWSLQAGHPYHRD